MESWNRLKNTWKHNSLYKGLKIWITYWFPTHIEDESHWHIINRPLTWFSRVTRVDLYFPLAHLPWVHSAQLSGRCGILGAWQLLRKVQLREFFLIHLHQVIKLSFLVALQLMPCTWIRCLCRVSKGQPSRHWSHRKNEGLLTAQQE